MSVFSFIGEENETEDTIAEDQATLSSLYSELENAMETRKILEQESIETQKRIEMLQRGTKKRKVFGEELDVCYIYYH